MHETNAGQRSFRVTTDVPQESILDPTLCNGVLMWMIPNGVIIVGSADDFVSTCFIDVRQNNRVIGNACNGVM